VSLNIQELRNVQLRQLWKSLNLAHCVGESNFWKLSIEFNLQRVECMCIDC